MFFCGEEEVRDGRLKREVEWEKRKWKREVNERGEVITEETKARKVTETAEAWSMERWKTKNRENNRKQRGGD